MRKMTGVPIVATAVLCCLCAPARATTYVVDQSGGGDFTNVQEGVDYAASGDTLLIMAGLYTENVVCPGKCLAYVGEGAGLSLVTAAEAAPTFDIQGPPGESAFAYMSVIPHDAQGRSVVWDMNRVALEHCEIPGRLGGGSSSSSFASVTITDCVVQRVDVWGGWLTSTITNSTVGPAAFHGRYIWEWGADWCQAHMVETSYSMLGDVSLSCDSNIDSHSDIMGVLSGGDGSSCSAVGTSFEGIDLGLGDLELVDCAVRGPVEVHGYAGVSDNTTWDVGIAGTLVEGDLVLHYVAFSDQVVFTIELVHNTVAGDLTALFDFSGSPTYVDQYHVLSNIVCGHTSLDGAFAWAANTDVLNNDFVGGFTFAGVAGTIQFNISLPALFCDSSSGDYHLQECSPCVAAAHDGGDIGAFGVGCDCATAVEEKSWGSIKALFRQPPN